MIVDGKVRKMKFSERVRENFERFKDRIEGIGRKALIGGILIGGSVGCASNGINGDRNNYGILTGDPIADIMIIELRSDIYAGCRSKEDSLRATQRVWTKKTGYTDPKDWEKVVAAANGELRGGYILLEVATIPYIFELGYNPPYIKQDTSAK